MYFVQHYVIDWDKVQSLDDLKRLFKAMNIIFEPNCGGLKDIEDLVRLEDKPKVSMSVMD